MKKRLFAIMLGFIIVFSLVGCATEPVHVNVSDNQNLSSNQFGVFVRIGNNLVYDYATRVVYIYNDVYAGVVYTPYYAPNGFPYRYNPKTNTFEEINN